MMVLNIEIFGFQIYNYYNNIDFFEWGTLHWKKNVFC